jgi:hypothetical protein
VNRAWRDRMLYRDLAVEFAGLSVEATQSALPVSAVS